MTLSPQGNRIWSSPSVAVLPRQAGIYGTPPLLLVITIHNRGATAGHHHPPCTAYRPGVSLFQWASLRWYGPRQGHPSWTSPSTGVLPHPAKRFMLCFMYVCMYTSCLCVFYGRNPVLPELLHPDVIADLCYELTQTQFAETHNQN